MHALGMFGRTAIASKVRQVQPCGRRGDDLDLFCSHLAEQTLTKKHSQVILRPLAGIPPAQLLPSGRHFSVRFVLEQVVEPSASVFQTIDWAAAFQSQPEEFE